MLARWAWRGSAPSRIDARLVAPCALVGSGSGFCVATRSALGSYRELIVIEREGWSLVAEPCLTGLFLSWSHQDRALKEDLVRRLTPNLSILRGVRAGWWEDSDLLIGDVFRSAIVGELGNCDYGVLLVSPSYVASPFVAAYELPRFVGPAADKGALPVALRPLPLDGSRELRGIEQVMIFRYRGKAFSELSGAGRDGFAGELATQIRRRILHDRQATCDD
jgi:hypothetical protein